MKESPGTGFFPLGMVEIWVACPACTLNKITKARPAHELHKNKKNRQYDIIPVSNLLSESSDD